MKKVLSSLLIAFAMYSKLPMPKVDFEEDAMKYVMIFFPFVGIVVGAVVFCCLHFGNQLGFSPIFIGGAVTVLPILITGGIHFDGFMDTVDAISSWGSREKKLEILKDPHIGAFGVIYGIVFGVIFFASAVSLPNISEAFVALAIAFVLSRAISGICACNLKSANSGSLSMFKNASNRNVCNICLFLILGASCGLLVTHGGVYGIAVMAVQLLWMIYYKAKAYRIFGGVTGDTAGYFLQIAEVLSFVAVAVLGVLL